MLLLRTPFLELYKPDQSPEGLCVVDPTSGRCPREVPPTGGPGAGRRQASGRW